MDVLAHILWTNAVYRSKYSEQRKKRYIAAFFGVLPDLMAFTPAFIYFIINRSFLTPAALGSGHQSWTLEYARQAYNYSHSLVVFLFLLIIVTLIGNLYLYTKDKFNYKFWFYWPLLGWALHIVIDIFCHKDFYATPFLFPISNFRNSFAIQWSNPTFMVINYSAIIAVYVVIFILQRRKYAAKTQ